MDYQHLAHVYSTIIYDLQEWLRYEITRCEDTTNTGGKDSMKTKHMATAYLNTKYRLDDLIDDYLN